MGCCASRNNLGALTRKEEALGFIEGSGLNKFSFAEIRRIDTQILKERIDRETFELFLKGSGLKCSFAFFAVNGVVSRFDLKVTLLLFNRESCERKKEVFEEFVNSERKVMRFLEWRFQLVYERLPIELGRMNKLDLEEFQRKIDKARLTACEEIQLLYSSISSDRSTLTKLNILSI